jgi:putative redox protein
MTNQVTVVDNRPQTNVTLQWEGGFKFTASDEYDHQIIVDAPPTKGDHFGGFKPGELLLTSLAACSGIDIVGILRKQRQKVTSIEIRVEGTQSSDPPWAWEEVELRYIVRGNNLRESAVDRAVHLSEKKYCSVGATIGAITEIRSTVEIIEECPNQ